MKIVFEQKVFNELLKSKDLSKLVKKQITDKNGHRRTVYVRPEDAAKAPMNNGKEGINKDVSRTGKESNNISQEVGDVLTFERNGKTLTGTVIGVGNDGLTVNGREEASGIQYQVLHKDVKSSYKNPSKFNASDWAKSSVDPKVTADSNGIDYILSRYGEAGKEIAKKAEETENRVVQTESTISKYRVSGEGEDAKYTPERERLHRKIIRSFFDPDKIKTAHPANGKAPVFVMLGGRGGSGKSWFTKKGGMFDKNKYVIVDSDAIKEMLPEYEGWNAGQVHEESSDISKKVIDTAINVGVNIILDGTMNNPAKAVKKIQEFNSLGYRTEAHYMHLPVQESTKRAIDRFKTEQGNYSGRFVPLNVLVSMQDNEKAFDEVKNIVDDWSFRSNFKVKRGEPPKLVSQKK